MACTIMSIIQDKHKTLWKGHKSKEEGKYQDLMVTSTTETYF